MQYKLYNFTGITSSNNTTISISLKNVIKDYSDMFSSVSATTNELFESKGFCFEADYYEMESICKCIEDGLVVVPFSRTFFIMDLIPYYNLNMHLVFMTIKDYKQFKKDYTDSLMTVEDKRTKELF